MDIKELAERARSQLVDITGLKPLSVTGTSRDEEGWHIMLEMLEMSRIPSSSDVLGDYEVVLDERGGMLRFERKRTRLRGEPTEAEERAHITV